MTKTFSLVVFACLLVAGLFSPDASANRWSEAALDNTEPHAAYPRWTRPPGYARDFDTWQDAKGPDVGETTADPARLPSRVDNSERPEFPPVYRQRWGACGQFASVASVFTYEWNVAHGTVADSNQTRFPAHFSWNMMNRADNRGSEAYHGWEVAKQIGIPTAAKYGGVRLDTIGLWPNGYDVWRDAMTHRVAGYRYTPVVTVDQLNEARGWLYDRNRPDAEGEAVGGVFAIDGRMASREDRDKVTAKIPDGEHAAGQDLWTAWGPTGYGHGMACVGYDDNVGYDVNGDGKITNDVDINGDGKVTLADWERGAFIVVNSWGKKWSGDGRIYLLYSVMTDKTWPRGQFIGRIEVARHQPRVTLRLKLACDNRTDLRISVGIAGDPDADAADHTVKPEAFNGWPIFRGSNPGAVPLAGPERPEPIEVGIDLTHLVDRLGDERDGKARLFLNLSRADGSKATGRLHEAAVRLYASDGTFLREVPLPVGDGAFGEAGVSLSAVVAGLAE